MQVSTQVIEAEIRAVVTRADGTVEDLGVIDSYVKPNPGLERNMKRKGAQPSGDNCN